MADIVLSVDGIQFHSAAPEAEPMARDEDVARSLGFARPRKVRELIVRLRKEGFLNDSDYCPTVGRVPSGAAGTREATQYLLTETGAWIVALRSDAPSARNLVRAVAEAFARARKMIAPPAAAPALKAAMADMALELRDAIRDAELAKMRIRDLPAQKANMAAEIKACAYELSTDDYKCSIHRVAAEVRRLACVRSEYDVTMALYPIVLAHLRALGRREVACLSLAMANPTCKAAPAQMAFEFLAKKKETVN